MSRAIRRNRVMGVGALPILAGLLLASGMLRLGDGTVALVLESLSDSHKAHAAAPGDVLPEDDVAELLSALEARQAELDERAQTLEAESSKVTEGREALRAQLAEIEAAEAELRELLQMADSAAEEDLSRLAEVYQAMKPAEAAALFEKMPPTFAAGFLGLMPPATSAAILAKMPPDAAYAVSVMLAGRHADIPKE